MTTRCESQCKYWL